MFAFLGPNGAGKTTTIRLLLDLIRPSKGSATVLGHDVSRESLAVRRLTGYLPGELNLYERLTALEMLEHLAALRGGVRADRIGELAGRIGLDLGRRIGDLSKGNRQKVGVVAAFMHEPELLMLDEPTSGLDPLRQRAVHELMRERVGGGATVFLSSHALDEVEHVADRVGIIREGSLVAVEEMRRLRDRAVRQVTVRFGASVTGLDLDRIPGVRDISLTDGVARLRVEGSMDPLVKALAAYPVQTLTSERPELEEIFLGYYGSADEA